MLKQVHTYHVHLILFHVEIVPLPCTLGSYSILKQFPTYHVHFFLFYVEIVLLPCT